MDPKASDYIQNKKISDFDDVVKNAMFDRFDKNPEIKEMMGRIEHYKDIVKSLSEN